jgi:hypothetical protein
LVCGGSLLSGEFASFLFVSGVESLGTGSPLFGYHGGVVDGSAVVKGVVMLISVFVGCSAAPVVSVCFRFCLNWLP